MRQSDQPAGWFPDPHKRFELRWWDGVLWTPHVSSAGIASIDLAGGGATALEVRDDGRSTAVVMQAGDGFDSEDAPAELDAEVRSTRGAGLTAGLKRFAKSAKESPLTQKAAEAAASAGRAVSEAAHDAATRKALFDAATPTLYGALDGANLRNRNGKIKVWRVARAAARPRKSLTGAGQGAAAASGSQLRSALESAASHDRQTYDDDQIAAEWLTNDARDDWTRGVRLFESAGTRAEVRLAAELLCSGLASCLTADPVLSDDDLAVEAAGNVLAIVLAEEDHDLWDDGERRLLRVALAIARRTGTQPESVGGNGEFETLFQDATSRMRAALAVSTTGWPCDLARWFGKS